mgnify:CR=1 FL=1
MSIVDLDAAADVLSALGAAMLAALWDLDSPSAFAGAGFVATSLDVDRVGMFRMSLYFVCLFPISLAWAL